MKIETWRKANTILLLAAFLSPFLVRWSTSSWLYIFCALLVIIAVSLFFMTAVHNVVYLKRVGEVSGATAQVASVVVSWALIFAVLLLTVAPKSLNETTFVQIYGGGIGLLMVMGILMVVLRKAFPSPAKKAGKPTFWVQFADLSIQEHGAATRAKVEREFTAVWWTQESKKRARVKAMKKDSCPPGMGINYGKDLIHITFTGKTFEKYKVKAGKTTKKKGLTRTQALQELKAFLQPIHQ